MTTMQLRTNQSNDSELVELAKAGDAGAFDSLVRRFQRAVYAVAFGVLSDSDAARDVIQETFIAAYHQLTVLEQPSKFGPWVCGIARNQAKGLYRNRRQLHHRELPLVECAHSTDRPMHDAAGLVSEALGSLSEFQAEVVTLFYMEGYSIAECARLLEVPEGTIKRRLHDARQRLKKEMTDMVKQHLKEFALPEDHRVVFEKTTPIHTAKPQLVYFRDRWVLLWQDGCYWEPWDGPFWFWVSESKDGRDWSEPRKLDLPDTSDAMRINPDYLGLMNACVAGDRLFFLTHNFSGEMDLYSSEDAANWTTHPRIRMGRISRGSIFGSGNDLCLVYPSLIGGCDRVDMIRSSDGGFSWTWLNSPYAGDGCIYDVAGIVTGGETYIAWRKILSRWEATGEMEGVVPCGRMVNAHEDPAVPQGALSQQVWIGRSDDGCRTWGHRVRGAEHYPDGSGIPPSALQPGKLEPKCVDVLDIRKPYSSCSLQFAAFGDSLALAQEILKNDSPVEVWVALSRDRGRTWPEKAVYSSGSLSQPAVAFAPDGTLLLAGSSRTGSTTRPWVVHSHLG